MGVVSTADIIVVIPQAASSGCRCLVLVLLLLLQPDSSPLSVPLLVYYADESV